MMPVIYLHHFWFAGTDWAWFLLYRMYLQAASYQESSFPKWGNWWFLIYLFVPLCSFVTCVDRTACFFSGHSWLQSEDHRSLQSLWIKFLDYLLPCFSLLFFFVIKACSWLFRSVNKSQFSEVADNGHWAYWILQRLLSSALHHISVLPF